MSWLEEYLARCAELGIERVERGTREFIAWPGPKLLTESGPENGSKSQMAGGSLRRKISNTPAQRDQSVTRTLFKD